MTRAIAATLVCVACLAVPAAAGTSTETVSVVDYQLSLPSSTYDAGTWTFSVHSGGAVNHAVEIVASDGRVVAGPATIAPGATVALPTVSLAPGLYTFLCTIHASMHEEVGFRGVGSASLGPVFGITDTSARVAASATANGDTGATAVLTLAAGPGFTDVRTVTVPLSGFARAQVGQVFGGLQPSTLYRFELAVHGDRGTSTVQRLTFHTRATDVLPPTVRLTVPRSRSVRAWSVLHGVATDPAPSYGLAHVEVSVRLRRGRACLAYVSGRFAATSCSAGPTWTRLTPRRSRFSLALAGLRPGDLTVRTRAFDVAGHTGTGATVAVHLHA